MHAFTGRLNLQKAILLVIIITIPIYANSLANGFVWDDAWIIVNNDFIKSWANFPLLFSQSYLTSIQNLSFLGIHPIGSGETTYRPVATLTYFIDYFLWGLMPFGYHLTNLVLHIINAVLLYILTVLLSKKNLLALFATLLFALHPVNSEAVNAISFREDLLVSVFFLLAFIFYIELKQHNTQKKTIFYICSLFSFLLALFSKEMALILPLVLILYDYYFTPYDRLQTIRANFKSYYLGYILIYIFYLWARGMVMANTDIAIPYAGGNFYVNAMTMLGVVVKYIQWLFFPLGIHATIQDSTYLIIYSFSSEVLFSLFVISVFLALAIATFKHAKEVSFAIFWFFISLIPVLNIIPTLNTLMAARYLYLPAAGFCLFLAAVIFYLPETRFFRKQAKRRQAIITVAVIIILLFYSSVTLQRNLVWRDNLSLWQEIIKYYPKSSLAHTDMGAVFEKKGLLNQAIAEYKIALSLEPDYTKARFGLANCYYMKDMMPEAISEYKKALGLIKGKANSSLAFFNVSVALRAKGFYKEAADILQKMEKY